jgi:hypothetical protein
MYRFHFEVESAAVSEHAAIGCLLDVRSGLAGIERCVGVLWHQRRRSLGNRPGLKRILVVHDPRGQLKRIYGYAGQGGGDMQTKSEDMRTVYAATRDGYELPVIDVTSSRFRVPDDAAAQRALMAAVEESERKRRFLPKFVLRWMLKSASKQSRLVNALFGTSETFLDGITTYVMKLGAQNLVAPYSSPVDLRFAASPHVTFLRLRTQQMAELMAARLLEHLKPDGRPLAIVNIAGGPAIDSLNALLLLTRRDPALLSRKVTIHVLDRDDAGAFFGRNAFRAMQAAGCPLAGYDIDFDHRTYDWDDTSGLTDLLARLAAEGAVVAASSEGGLFEYGSDDAIVANLKALHGDDRGALFVVGSVTRDDELRRRMMVQSRIKLIPRGLKGFEPLARRAGYAIVETRPTIWSDQVVMLPSL